MIKKDSYGRTYSEITSNVNKDITYSFMFEPFGYYATIYYKGECTNKTIPFTYNLKDKERNKNILVKRFDDSMNDWFERVTNFDEWLKAR